MKDFIDDNAIALMEHCIGLDRKKPYTRHGKQFYKPYRNYYYTTADDSVWCCLETLGYAVHGPVKMIDGRESCDFYLTHKGFGFLSDKLKICIHDYI